MEMPPGLAAPGNDLRYRNNSYVLYKCWGGQSVSARQARQLSAPYRRCLGLREAGGARTALAQQKRRVCVAPACVPYQKLRDLELRPGLPARPIMGDGTGELKHDLGLIFSSSRAGEKSSREAVEANPLRPFRT
jgi:hypothetical protein